MAVTYGFYNALNHDRLYDAIQMSSIFDGIIRDGIFSTIGDTMIVTAPEDGMYVNVGSGRAWFNHTWTLNDTAYPIEAEQAEVVLDRIDAVILEVNSSSEVRANSIKFLKGTPSSNPVKPTLTHNAEVNQYALAYVRIRAGQTTIFQSDIENAVGTDETPFITGVLQQVSIETLLKQWEAEFNTYFTNFQNTSTTEFNNWLATKVSEYTAWFAQMQTDMDSNFNEFDAWFQRMKDQLDENQAGHLQLQIDNLSGRIDDLDAEMPFAGGSKVNINFEYDVKPNIQYSNEHYKLTVGDTVRENNFSASKLHFDEYGILTVGDGILEVTYDVTDSRTGKITHASYTYTINMPYFGRFAYNVTISASLYNYQGWLASIGKDSSSYPTIEDVFADEKLLRELMTRHASVDYLVEWLANNNEDAHTVLNNDYCAKWINLRDYALDKLYVNPTVKAVMDEVDKYGYGEWALVNQVPKMTSNTTPSGKASCGSNGTDAYCAFDNSLATKAAMLLDTQTDGASYVQYEFDEPTKIVHADIRLYYSDKYTFISGCKYTLKASNNQTDWDVLYEWTQTNKSDVIISCPVSTNVAYKYYRLDASKGNYKTSSGSFFNYVFEISLFKWQPKGVVPVMTSNTAPYGEASASSVYQNAYHAYRAFDGESMTDAGWVATANTDCWIQYKFTNPIKVNRVSLMPRNSNNNSGINNFKVQGSNDGNIFEDIYTGKCNGTVDSYQTFTFNNDHHYLYYRIHIVDIYSGAAYCGLQALQFYGRQLNVSVPTMTSNTTPYGEVIGVAQDYCTKDNLYKGFNSDTTSTDQLYLDLGTTRAYITYKFPKKILLKYITTVRANAEASRNINEFKIQGSNDGSVFTDIQTITDSVQTLKGFAINNNTEYQYYKFVPTAPTTGLGRLSQLIYYGLDYSEREFEEGSTMKYLYDHGVEFEEIDGFSTNSSSAFYTKEPNQLYVNKTVNNSISLFNTANGIDISPYKLLRGIAGDKFAYAGGNVDISIRPAHNDVSHTISQNNLSSNFNELPNNIFLDVSSINSVAYPVMATNDGGTVISMSLKEWWLE